MALAALGVLDLSVITDTLIALLEDSIANSPLWSSENPAPARFPITVTGAQPEAVQNDGNCQLSLYLLHVCQDKFQRNSPVMGSRSSMIPQQPLGLDLYYLLTAYAGKSYTQEQQALSIGVRCFYNSPIIKTVVQGDAHQEFTLNMEVDSADERSRLWQALAIPLRLSVVYRVSVVFITPDAADTQPAPPPKNIGLAVDPTSLPYNSSGQVFGTLRTVFYPSPDNTATNPDIRKFDLSPATAASGETFFLMGSGFNQDTSRRIYLLSTDGTEKEVTSWIVPAPLPPGTAPSSTKFILRSPAAPNTPVPGIYQLRVGSDASRGDKQTIRSNTTPFSIAALVVGPPTTAPALLVARGGIFTLKGAGFAPGKTEVLLETIALSTASGTPGAGQFSIGSGGTSISFRSPGNLASGRYAVRIRVNQVESAPTWWINIP